MSQPDLSIEQFTEKVWASAYPDRQPWNKIDQSARDEWIRVMRVALNLYVTYPNRRVVYEFKNEADFAENPARLRSVPL